MSRTAELFYTVRCTVSGMNGLHQSLEDVCVKDTLEGDNMYTCSQCNKKVRAEKRACFKHLPKILAFNTMRYTFNMITMLKEKVNTHFSFPFRLDMSPYMEHNLIPNDKQEMTAGAASTPSTSPQQPPSASSTSQTKTQADVVSGQMRVDEEKSSSVAAKNTECNVNKGSDRLEAKVGGRTIGGNQPCYEYELIGVTVHTGTADGGHYYAFIRDRSNNGATDVKCKQEKADTGNGISTTGGNADKWYSFNDAEVKPFDPVQIAAECFGGEMNSRTYDQVTDKFMDLSIEKTNSAYMLFYERVSFTEDAEAGPSSSFTNISTETAASSSVNSGNSKPEGCESAEESTPQCATSTPPGLLTRDTANRIGFNLSQDLEEWIWKDNMNFIQDNNIFDHMYFNFMWQMVGYIPTTLHADHNEDITLFSAKLATSFFLESFIHAKEKLNIVQWVELLTKQFDSSTSACAWLLSHMAEDNNWPVTIFLKCQVATIRQMFHRLCIHVIQKLR